MRTLTLAVLGLPLLCASLASAQPVPAGQPVGKQTALETTLDGQSLEGRVGLELIEGRRTLVARMGDWSGRGQRVGPNRYRFVLHRERQVRAGASGVLQGLQGEGTVTESMELLVDRSNGGFRAALRKDGKVLSRVRPPAPPASEPPTLIRRTWWGRYPVALWGTLRTTAGFLYHRDFEGDFRGDHDRQATRRLRQSLEEFTPKPWGPTEIYRAARELSLSDYDALQLAFAFSADEDWERRELIGIGPEEPLADKYEHYFASAVMANRSNARSSFFVGWLKEVGDIPGTGYSEPDLMADALGAEFGESIAAGVIHEHARPLPLPR